MSIVERSALVHYLPAQMFELVNRVDRYREFLRWCSHSEILEHDPVSMLARISVRLGGVERVFVTRNQLVAPDRIGIELVEGPFSNLQGEWHFQQLGEAGCKITLKLRFEFSSQMLNGAFRQGFAKVANRLVNDFCKRAESVYG